MESYETSQKCVVFRWISWKTGNQIIQSSASAAVSSLAAVDLCCIGLARLSSDYLTVCLFLFVGLIIWIVGIYLVVALLLSFAFLSSSTSTSASSWHLCLVRFIVAWLVGWLAACLVLMCSCAVPLYCVVVIVVVVASVLRCCCCCLLTIDSSLFFVPTLLMCSAVLCGAGSQCGVDKAAVAVAVAATAATMSCHAAEAIHMG